MTSPSASAHPLTFTDQRFRPAPARRSGRTRSHVVLEPLVPASRLDTSPVGYLGRPPGEFDGPEEEIAWVRWTVDALAVLAPGAFLAAPITAEALTAPVADERLGGFGRHLMPILESARVGGRLVRLERARDKARELGLRCAVGGHRVAAADGFDAVVIDPVRMATTVVMGDCRLFVATGLKSPDEIGRAREMGADLIQGDAVADPLRVAPVDVSRLQR